MTPEQLAARKKKLVSAARALITGDMGLVPAATNISYILRSLMEHAPNDCKIFDEFYQAIPMTIPLGTARLEWPIDLLLEFDEVLTEVEREYRPRLLKAASALITNR